MNTTVSQIEESDIRAGLSAGGIGGMYMPSTLAAFTDFTAGLATESDNIQDAREKREEIVLEAKEKEQESDQNQDMALNALVMMQNMFEPEDYELQNWNINGQDYQVSNAGIQTTLERIRNDLDGMVEEYNLSDDQKQKLQDLEEEMRGKSPEEQQAILERYAENNPEAFNAFMDQSKKRSIELKSNFAHKTQTTLTTTKIDETISTDNDSFDDFSNESVLAESFNPNAIGEIPEIDIKIANATPSVNYGLI